MVKLNGYLSILIFSDEIAIFFYVNNDVYDSACTMFILKMLVLVGTIINIRTMLLNILFSIPNHESCMTMIFILI